ncbi:MAG: DsrE/DsrF/TusD sulfur relay family protein [Bacteroidota bacterium]
MKILVILNDAPYGTEKVYNALRIAMQAHKGWKDEVWIFLLADVVGCAIPDQHTPQGYHNVERMLRSVLSKGGKVKACRSCLDTRGFQLVHLIEGVERSSMAEVTHWGREADKTVPF